MAKAFALTERALAGRLRDLMAKAGLRLLDTEVRIGSFRLDAVAFDDRDNSLVVVELKTNRWYGTLAQLLLYPRALNQAIADEGILPPPIRSLLITTYLDKGLIDLIANHGLSDSVELLVCVGSEERGLKLVNPLDAEAEAVLFDQASGKRNVARVVDALRAIGIKGDGGD